MALPQARPRLLRCLAATLVAALLSFAHAPTQANAASTDDFIASVVPMAQRGEREHGVPASVAIAQSILESGWGRSRLTLEANSFFGIKCFRVVSPYQNGCYSITTMEYRPDGSSYTTTAKFRKYDSEELSFMDHGLFLRTNSRYATAFAYTANPERFIHEVHKAGYATDPRYASSVIAIIQRYGLNRYNVTPRSNAVLTPSVFGTTDRTVVVGSRQEFIVSYYADPRMTQPVTWQESRDGGKTWRTVAVRSGLDSVETFGYRAHYIRTIGDDNGLKIRAKVSNAKGVAYSAAATLTVKANGSSPPITRLGGADRYEAAANMVSSQFAPGSAPVIYIASVAFPKLVDGSLS